MKRQLRSKGFNIIISNQKIVDLEAKCRKVHGEAVIESIIIAFSVPTKVTEKLFSYSNVKIDGKKTTTSYRIRDLGEYSPCSCKNFDNLLRRSPVWLLVPPPSDSSFEYI